MYCRQWSRSAGLKQRPLLVDDAQRGFVGTNQHPEDRIDPSKHLWMQFHRTLDRRLGMKLGRKTDLEQHVLDHVAAIRTRQAEWLSPEQNVIKTPGRGSQHRRVTHFTLE
jgi:hypothetical protein